MAYFSGGLFVLGMLLTAAPGSLLGLMRDDSISIFIAGVFATGVVAGIPSIVKKVANSGSKAVAIVFVILNGILLLAYLGMVFLYSVGTK